MAAMYRWHIINNCGQTIITRFFFLFSHIIVLHLKLLSFTSDGWYTVRLHAYQFLQLGQSFLPLTLQIFKKPNNFSGLFSFKLQYASFRLHSVSHF
jgi:hypothetical protein